MIELNKTWRFGEFELDPRERRLSRADAPIDLPPKVFDALVLLVERAGQRISKDDFYAALWPKAVVSEANLNKYIWQIRKALGDDGEHYIATLPKLGYRFVAPVSAVSAGSPPVVETDSAPVSSEPSLKPAAPTEADVVAVAPAQRRHRRYLSAAAIAMALAGLVVFILSWQSTISPERLMPQSTGGKPSVALLDFDDTDKAARDPWLATALPELLGLDLAVAEQVRIVPGDQVDQAVRDLPRQSDDRPDMETLRRLREQLGADLVVTGAFRTGAANSRDEVGLQLRIVDTHTGRMVGSVAENGSADHLREMVAEISTRLREQLGLDRLSENLAAVRDSEITADAESLRHYGAGIVALRRMDAQSAIDQLSQATTRAPNFLPASLALARAMQLAGDDTRAARVARDALSRAATAPRELRLALEAVAYEAQKDWPDAIDTYQALSRFFPEEIEYALGLAHAQAMAGRGADAQSTLRALRKDRQNDPRIDLAFAEIAQMHSDWAAERDAAARAISGANAVGARLLKGRALLLHGWALDFLGDKPAALTDYRQAAALFGRESEPLLSAQADVKLAGAYYDNGQFAQAETIYRGAYATFQNLGAKGGQAAALANIASIEYAQGKLKPAWQDTETVLQLRRELGDSEGEAWALSALATIELEQGQSDAALATYEDAIALNQRIGNQANLAWALMSLADLQRLRGDYVDARKNVQHALDIQTTLGSKDGQADVHSRYGVILRDAGDFAGARRHLQAALAIEQALKENYKAAAAQADLARVALREHKPKDALALLDAAQSGLSGAGAEADNADAEATRAVALAKLGRHADARSAMEAALRYAKSHPSSLDALSIRCAHARLELAHGDKASAVSELRALYHAYNERRLAGAAARIDVLLQQAVRSKVSVN